MSDYVDMMSRGFEDELEKIALFGFGKKKATTPPSGASAAAGRTTRDFAEESAERFGKSVGDTAGRAGSALGKFVGKHWKPLALIGGGAAGYKALSQANKDRRLGRQLRLQSGGSR